MGPGIKRLALGTGVAILVGGVALGARGGALTARMGVAGLPGSTAAIAVQPVWEVKGPPRLELGGVAGMGETGDGSVWITDDMNRRIVRVSADGTGFRVAARQGQGPGEFAVPTMIAPRPDGGVAVYDIERQSLELFSSSGAFEKSVPLDRQVINPKGFAILSNGEAILSGALAAGEGSIHRFGVDGRLRSSWYPIPRSRDEYESRLIAGGPVAARPDGGLYFSQAAPHRISMLTLQRNRTRQSIVAEDPHILRPIADDFSKIEGHWRTFRWWFPQSKGIFVLPDGRLLNIITNAEEGYSLWELYSRGGERE
ncbi:MAG TPA: hypothetical protein VFQ39_17155, partial [Longimicrobium sp.]|nr:hypothetical protein [Longimicrobium sp.]